MSCLVTLPVTTPDQLAGLTTEAAAKRAVNQLLSVVVGKWAAKGTDHLKDEPSQRVQACLQITSEEYQKALKQLASDPNASKMVSQCQRKLDSIASLQTIANLINETEWE